MITAVLSWLGATLLPGCAVEAALVSCAGLRERYGEPCGWFVR